MPRTASIRSDIRDAVAPLAIMFLASRAVLLLIAGVTLQIAGAHGFNGEWAPLLCRWDCVWYIDLAKHGYSMLEQGNVAGESNFGFYPMFPLLTRLVSPLFGGNALYAGILLSNLCFAAALVYVYLYVRALELGRTVALLTVWLVCIFPLSLVFSAPYTEGLCLLELAAAMYHLRRQHYLAAGIAAAMLSATRPNGVLFIVFAVIWLWRQAGVGVFFRPWLAPEKFIPIVLAPLGAFLFFGYCFMATGDAFAHSSTQLVGWGWTFAPPWKNLPELLSSGGIYTYGAVVSFAVAVCSLLLLKQKMYEEFAFCAAMIALIWCGQGMVSVFRYWLILFPVWMGVARALVVRPMAVAVVSALLGMVSGLMACAWALESIISM